MGILGSSSLVVVVTLDSDEVFIVVSLYTRIDTQAKLGFDVFKSQGKALNFITNESRFACRSRTLVRVNLGYSVMGNVALLFIAMRLIASIRITRGRVKAVTTCDQK
ncbi:hypothetical protein JHK82_042384 [Glycine max]|nr:hypothetical protein JHK86_042425 [Glycine max]KAG5105414.1 hypothetical protein JHK82_042384 [Glycine max]KAG5116541.1 hypothetical protein JHK84_042654 [Glycine max]